MDFQTQVVIGLGRAVSLSCPEITFEGLVVTDDRVYGEYDIDSPLLGGCENDASAAAFWLIVDRAVLPDRFTLAVEQVDRCEGCVEDEITVDLSTDEPDASQWWLAPQLVIAAAGPFPEHSYGLRSTFTDGEDTIALLPEHWTTRPHMLRNHPAGFPVKVEGFVSDCDLGEPCTEDPAEITPVGPICSEAIDMSAGEDTTVLIRFASDGTCKIETMAGAHYLD